MFHGTIQQNLGLSGVQYLTGQCDILAHCPVGPIKWGLGHFPRTFLPEKNENNVVEIEAGMIKQYFSSRSWIDERICC